jgi:hypothetical protein
MTSHPAQMVICHEHIDPKAATSAHPETYAFCNMAADSWCFDCGYYVCEIHVVARHERHRLQERRDELAEHVDQPTERRSGQERRHA